jgi:HK97 family phage portal protein
MRSGAGGEARSGSLLVRTRAALSAFRKNPLQDDAREQAVTVWSPGVQAPPDQYALDQQEQIHPVVYACVRTIQQDASQTPLKLYEKTTQGDMNEVEDHPLLDVLRQPNEADTSGDWMMGLYGDLLMAGNHFSWVHLEGAFPGIPKNLIWMPPREVEPIPDPQLVIGGYKRMTPGGKTRIYPPEQVWHFKMPNRKNRYRGMAAAERLRDPIAIDQQMVKWRYSLFYNGVPVEILLRTSNAIDSQSKRDRLYAELDKTFMGRQNGGRRYAVVNSDTWEVQVLPRAKDDETGYHEGRRLERALIAMVFGVPPNKLMDFEDSSGLSTNAESQERLYWEDTIAGLHRIVLDHFNSKILPRYFPAARNLVFKYDYSGIRAMNTSEQDLTLIHKDRFDFGMETLNEARRAMGLDKSDNDLADEHLFHGRPLGSDPVPLALPAPPPQEPAAPPAKAAVVPIPLRKDVRPEDLFDDDQEVRILRGLIDAEIRRMVQNAGEHQLELAGLSGAFNVTDPHVLAFVRTMLVRISQAVVPGTNEMVRRAIAEGLRTGLPVGSLDMKNLIQEAFKARRARWQLERIATTETHQAQEGAGFLAGAQAHFEYKRWITSRLPNVRGLDPKDAANHAGLEGVVVAWDSSWTDPRSGASLRYPGDREGGGKGNQPIGSDTINCHCSAVPSFEHLSEDERMAAGFKALSEPTLEELWVAKAAQRDRMEAALQRLIRQHLIGMQKRFIARYDRLASEKPANVLLAL